jgi:hypothetical protein
MKRLIVAVLVAGSLISASTAFANSKAPHWKTESPQTVGSKWTTLAFNEGSAMPARSGRALYSVQVRIDCTKKTKPRYVKIRLSRILPDGSRDTTGTNTWLWTKQGPRVFYASHMWQIKATHPVEAQIKIVGGTCKTVTTRQFKLWQPNGTK